MPGKYVTFIGDAMAGRAGEVGAEPGAGVADLVPVPGAGEKAGVAQGGDVAGDARGGHAVTLGQRRG